MLGRAHACFCLLGEWRTCVCVRERAHMCGAWSWNAVRTLSYDGYNCCCVEAKAVRFERGKNSTVVVTERAGNILIGSACIYTTVHTKCEHGHSSFGVCVSISVCVCRCVLECACMCVKFLS